MKVIVFDDDLETVWLKDGLNYWFRKGREYKLTKKFYRSLYSVIQKEFSEHQTFRLSVCPAFVCLPMFSDSFFRRRSLLVSGKTPLRSFSGFDGPRNSNTALRVTNVYFRSIVGVEALLSCGTLQNPLSVLLGVLEDSKFLRLKCLLFSNPYSESLLLLICPPFFFKVHLFSWPRI